ncbi:MAG: NAD-dependent epimerase/dehydratase family protein [Gammaproteobacteria bacterium]|nr:NAD-dependent epimerase/dehydratase family protein [Gammaproteobacteria bacterium]MCP5423582.1 NAD-dependent epimerase/dehydratase family protein [Gammaproteobacteria bacterium]
MKVFITGVTGYIGFQVALAMRRAGHEVWGLVRNSAKATRIARHEIHPVTGTLQQPEGYRAIMESCSVLIHAAVDYQANTFDLDRQAVEAMLATATSGAQPKTLIYTSGVWVFGDTGGQQVDETTPLNPPNLVTARPATEQRVLQAKNVRGLVVRPGCVYGRRGGLTGMWFGGAQNNALQIIGTGEQRWAMVHIDDLAAGYVSVAESGLAGEAFNFTDHSRHSVGEMVQAIAKVAGCSSPAQCVPVAEAAQTLGDFAECLTLDQHVDARKAARLLGWQPKHGGLVDEVATYYETWRAYQD